MSGRTPWDNQTQRDFEEQEPDFRVQPQDPRTVFEAPPQNQGHGPYPQNPPIPPGGQYQPPSGAQNQSYAFPHQGSFDESTFSTRTIGLYGPNQGAGGFSFGAREPPQPDMWDGVWVVVKKSYSPTLSKSAIIGKRSLEELVYIGVLAKAIGTVHQAESHSTKILGTI